MLTPREAESDFNNDQLTAIRAYFTRRLRRGDRSIDAQFRYLPFDQEPPIAAYADNVPVVIKECRAAGWEVELERGKWEFKTPSEKAQLAEQRAIVSTAGKNAEFSPGSMASGSATELNNIKSAKIRACMELGGWVRGTDGCDRCGGTRQEHVSG